MYQLLYSKSFKNESQSHYYFFNISKHYHMLHADAQPHICTNKHYMHIQ